MADEHLDSSRSGRWSRWKTPSILLASIASLLLLVGLHVWNTGHLPGVRRDNVWSIAIYEGTTPFDLGPAPDTACPALTATDVADIRARFVADPFMIEKDSRWYLFAEILNADTEQGDIGLATSGDGRRWTYDRVILNEPFHLSYPFVCQWNGEVFLLPEAEESGQVRLYRANPFPHQWQLDTILLAGEDLADPTPFRWRDSWWMFTGRANRHDELRLFYADDLRGPWSEHPQSPLVQHDANVARPGGSVIVWDDRLYRLGQDCHPRYGNSLRAFEIQTLTRTDYHEDTSAPIPLFQGSGDGWNAAGMHHLNVHPLPGGHWIGCVDGHRKQWSFGFARP